MNYPAANREELNSGHNIACFANTLIISSDKFLIALQNLQFDLPS